VTQVYPELKGQRSMSFHRFENIESNFLTPHLSSARGPVIEGKYMYFCLVNKVAGTGSDLHYHPNELLIFPVRGKINAIVGKDRRIAPTGMFVHAPAYARHSMRATEDGDCSYLYIKDKTWTVVGLAEDEAVPDKAMTVAEVNKKYHVGDRDKHQKAQGQSQAVIEGVKVCYYPVVDAFDAPPLSAKRANLIEGERLAFGYFEAPAGSEEAEQSATHETFVYVLRGELAGDCNGEKKSLKAGDILQAARGDQYAIKVKSPFARYVTVRSTPYLENLIDSMTPEQAEQARINMKAN
jgi:quercetin dioxygenase-like cupin family protein